MDSGLYKELTDHGYLIKHKEAKFVKEGAWKVIEPQQLDFVSYYYEWPFGMIKDAALLTLEIQKIALKYNMILKDASAFNIQFVDGRPILIDTLSFEKYEEGKPWVAYKQFVENFLCPLLLMAKTDISLARLGGVFLDGIPVDIAAKILPLSTRLNLSLLIHIYAHASTQKKFSDKKLDEKTKSKKFTKTALKGLVDNLEGVTKKLSWSPSGTQWAEYYEQDHNNYKSESFRHKMDLVLKFIKSAKPKKVWDLGANTGLFSKIAAEYGAKTVAFDIDYGALEKNYQDIVKKEENKNILPLFLDLTNPTPSLGWENKERKSVLERGPVDVVMALALIHHLSIAKNVPFEYLAETFSKIGKYLIIEFVDKKDSQVQILLSTREDIFPNYTRDDFEKTFSGYFKIKEAVEIKGSKRVLYLMESK